MQELVTVLGAAMSLLIVSLMKILSFSSGKVVWHLRKKNGARSMARLGENHDIESRLCDFLPVH